MYVIGSDKQYLYVADDTDDGIAVSSVPIEGKRVLKPIANYPFYTFLSYSTVNAVFLADADYDMVLWGHMNGAEDVIIRKGTELYAVDWKSAVEGRPKAVDKIKVSLNSFFSSTSTVGPVWSLEPNRSCSVNGVVWYDAYERKLRSKILLSSIADKVLSVDYDLSLFVVQSFDSVKTGKAKVCKIIGEGLDYSLDCAEVPVLKYSNGVLPVLIYDKSIVVVHNFPGVSPTAYSYATDLITKDAYIGFDAVVYRDGTVRTPAEFAQDLGVDCRDCNAVINAGSYLMFTKAQDYYSI